MHSGSEHADGAFVQQTPSMARVRAPAVDSKCARVQDVR